MTTAPRPSSNPNRGAALLTTLVVVSLLTIIVISFFAMVGVAKRSSSYHADVASLQNLKDSAVSLALAQVREGTTQGDQIWTSQPGAIRTFGEATGDPTRIYKLYSDDEMTVDASSLTSPAALNLATDVPGAWKDTEGVFVDLNKPVASMSDNDLHFPIVDPRLFDGKTDASSATPEGFSYSNQYPTGGSVDGVLGPDDASHPNDQRIPMPVKWIYQLRDGSLGTLDDSGKFKPFSNENDASPENPMVGRFAFWTDDESTKINLNTASEAIPWDTPKAATPEDVEFAKHPPVRNEVQRFGGHPAATSLSSVFFPNRELDPFADLEIYKSIYDLVPRVNVGGILTGATTPVPFDDDRLYANVEEALLQPTREENLLFQYAGPTLLERSRFLLTANSRAPEVTAAGTPRICTWPVSWRTRSIGNYRTAFDELIAFNSVLNGRPYIYRRHGANTNLGEYNAYYVSTSADPLGIGLASNGHLLRYMVSLGSQAKQGYSLSMLEKYGQQNLATGAISFTEYMRQTNLHDNTLGPTGKTVLPYARTYNNRAWGTEIHGQVTNIAARWLPAWVRNELSGNLGDGYKVRTNGIGRIYTASEVGFAFCLAAEHKSDGSKFNESLSDKLKLPKGYKAIQVMPLMEGFNPAQGFTMSAPSSSFQVRNPQQMRIKSSKGVRGPGGAVTEEMPDLKQQPHNDVGGWGRKNIGIQFTTAFLRNLAPGDPASDNRYSKANWWVGWGGSGGRWMYEGIDRQNSSFMKPWKPTIGDFDDPQRKIPTQYSRGFFLVPSDDETMELSFTGNNTMRFRVGNQRNGDLVGDWYCKLPSPMVIPVPEEPVVRSETWGARLKDAAVEDFLNPEILDPSDVVRTWVSRHGDHRLRYIREHENGSDTGNFIYVPHPDWDPAKAPANATSKLQIHSFMYAGGGPEPGATFKRGLVRGVDYAPEVLPDFTLDPDTDASFDANRPPNYRYALDPTDTRDWDNGTGIAPDGAYWNKVDDIAHQWNGGAPPYFSKELWDGSTPDAINETSAPNQQVPSPIVFGSLNSAAATGMQWTTYLFRPDLTPGGHLGSRDHTIYGDKNGAPPDHTILDWFWMPVVQPYAISERFSTAGKINMNYRIAPFSYINRSTGLHGAFKSERLLAIPTNAGRTYKNYASASSNTGWRHRIDVDETLKQFENKFDEGDVFRTESEICEQFLIPEGETLSGIRDFWDEHRLTGDNTLERPYANLYPRLTTRSNVYRIHLIAQTLRKSRDSDPSKFDSTLDSFVGEYRGEALVERAIDPNDPEIPNYVQDYNFTEPKLDNFYNYRVLYNRRFAP